MKITISHIRMTHSLQGRGYVIRGFVNDEFVYAHTMDSEAFDWYNDDSEPDLHKSAILHCSWKLEEAYYEKNQTRP